MKNKYLTKSDFLNSLLYQKSWVFHSLTDIESELKKLCDEIELDDDDNSSDEYENEVSDNIELFFENWKHEQNLENESISNLVNGLARQSQLIRANFIDQLIKLFGECEVLTIRDFNPDVAWDKTREAITSAQKNTVIIGACFIANGFCFTPSVVVAKGQGEFNIIEFKATSSTKRIHLLDVLFQKHVVSLTNLKTPYFLLGLVKFTSGKAKTVDIELTGRCNVSKTVKKVSDKIKKDLTYSELVEYKRVLKNGEESGIDLNEDYTSEIQKFAPTFNLNTHLEELKNRNEQKVTIDLIWPKQIFGTMPFRKQLVIPYFAKNVHPIFGWSGSSWATTGARSISAVLGDEVSNLKSSMLIDSMLPSYQECFHQNNPVVVNKTNFYDLFNSLKKKKVFFDFETINPAVRVLDNTVPFSQIITQNCAIWFDGEKEVKSFDILIDPLNMTVEDQKQIIDSLHWGSDASYIVYNKNFERSRLKELAILIPELSTKISEITENLYDLADYFTISKDILKFQKLKGYYSIKKVSNIIPVRFNEQAKFLSYTQLEDVQNGMQAQEKTMLRFYGLVSDDEWNKISKNLLKYCHNDVRAMIAIYLYLIDIAPDLNLIEQI